MFQIIREIFLNDVLEDDGIEIVNNTSANDVDQWDSFEQINLLTLLEQKFQVQFDIAKANSLRNIGELVDYVCEVCNEGRR